MPVSRDRASEVEWRLRAALFVSPRTKLSGRTTRLESSLRCQHREKKRTQVVVLAVTSLASALARLPRQRREKQQKM